MSIFKRLYDLFMEKGWTQFANARNADNDLVSPLLKMGDEDGWLKMTPNPRATCYCMFGALMLLEREVVNSDQRDLVELDTAANNELTYLGLPTVNGNMTHRPIVYLNDYVFKTKEEVLDFLKRNIPATEIAQ